MNRSRPACTNTKSVTFRQNQFSSHWYYLIFCDDRGHLGSRSTLTSSRTSIWCVAKASAWSTCRHLPSSTWPGTSTTWSNTSRRCAQTTSTSLSAASSPPECSTNLVRTTVNHIMLYVSGLFFGHLSTHLNLWKTTFSELSFHKNSEMQKKNVIWVLQKLHTWTIGPSFSETLHYGFFS